MSKVTVTVSGPVGSGKSAIAGEIEILCKALGLSDVKWLNGDEEKRLTHADWTSAIEQYNPAVEIVERIEHPEVLSFKERLALVLLVDFVKRTTTNTDIGLISAVQRTENLLTRTGDMK